jgi:hypothetical protein
MMLTIIIYWAYIGLIIIVVIFFFYWSYIHIYIQSNKKVENPQSHYGLSVGSIIVIIDICFPPASKASRLQIGEMILKIIQNIKKYA